jgi:ElaB/YqjD/DUF883 family membrane-anchored ribosome-binding protein
MDTDQTPTPAPETHSPEDQVELSRELSQAAKDLGEAAKARLEEVRSVASEKASSFGGEARTQARTVGTAFSRKAHEWEHQAEDYVRENPSKAAIWAFFAGLFFAFWWIRH